MDTKHCFELSAALQGWRAGLSGLAPDDVTELEGHLLDSVAELRSSGLTEPEAFEVAVRRLGSPGDLAAALGAGGGGVPSPSAPVTPGATRVGCRRAVSAFLLLVGGVTVILAGWAAWGALQPTRYFGRVLFKLAPSGGLSVPGWASESGSAAGAPVSLDERVATEYEVIRSSPVLARVVQRHDLVRRWGLASEEEAIRRLRSMVTVSQERGTDLVKLELQATDRKEAPRLANAVAEAYSAHKGEAWVKGRVEREPRMVAVLQEKEAAKERARQELLRVSQASGRTVQAADARGDEGGGGAVAEGVSPDPPPAGAATSEAERWAVDRARGAYERARADYEDTKRLMGQLAVRENTVTIHEFATEMVDYGANTRRYGLIASGVLAVLGAAAVAAGWRLKPRAGR